MVMVELTPTPLFVFKKIYIFLTGTRSHAIQADPAFTFNSVLFWQTKVQYWGLPLPPNPTESYWSITVGLPQWPIWIWTIKMHQGFTCWVLRACTGILPGCRVFIFVCVCRFYSVILSYFFFFLMYKAYNVKNFFTIQVLLELTLCADQTTTVIKMHCSYMLGWI